MKKIALFAATMLLCAGVAFAQQPQKKTNEKQAVSASTDTKQAVNEKQGCGKCPHHSQCQNQANTKSAEQVKPVSCCDEKKACKEEKKACKEEKKACKEEKKACKNHNANAKSNNDNATRSNK